MVGERHSKNSEDRKIRRYNRCKKRVGNEYKNKNAWKAVECGERSLENSQDLMFFLS